MMPFAFFLLKVTLCSGVLTGYYWLALRNKTFHRWNRFYLLFSVVLSLAAPLLKINIWQTDASASSKVFRILNIVTTEGEIVVESRPNGGFSLTTEQIALLGYSLISAIILIIISLNAVRIFKLIRAHSATMLGRITFLNTHAPGTPFSIFNYIVWNREIDIASETGQRIFQHELAHVQQRHSWDKVFLLLVLIPFWANPFFWIIRKELDALHEFCADEKALRSHDAAELAQLILNTAYPKQHFLFTNPFFQSTIKRRIAMFRKLQNPHISYWSRIAALPILLILIAAFSIRPKSLSGSTSRLALDKTITVVIDAGHGGKTGARSEGIYEDDIVLAISKKIKEQNSNSNIRILLTRENEQLFDLKKRVEMAAANNADLFISLHVNAADQMHNGRNTSGIEVVVPTKNPSYQQQSEILGSALVQELSGAYATQKNLIRTKDGIWVIDHNVCPAVLVECGYLTDTKDLAFITQDKNQSLIANKILDAIAQYGVLKNMNQPIPVVDTPPTRLYKNKPVADVQYFEWPEKKAVVLFADGSKESISIAEAFEANLFDANERSDIERHTWAVEKDTEPHPAESNLEMRKASITEAQKFKGVVILNDKIFKGTFQQLPVNENEIGFMTIVKGAGSAFEKDFGVKPGDSVLYITTKKFAEAGRRTDNEPLIEQPETEPKFPGDKNGWRNFLQKNLNAGVATNNGASSGTYKVIVGFIVDKDGKLHDIKPETRLGFGMEAEVVRLMKLSPEWIPAMQNGQKVTAYKKQTVTFIISEG